MYVTVMMPIEVPPGPFCWWWGKNMAEGNICKQFDNEGGHNHCTLGFTGQKDSEAGVLKAPACKCLVPKC